MPVVYIVYVVYVGIGGEISRRPGLVAGTLKLKRDKTHEETKR